MQDFSNQVFQTNKAILNDAVPSILCALQLDFSLVSIFQLIECKNVEKNQMFSMIIIVHPSHLLIYQSVIDVVKTMWMLCGLYPLVIESYS